MLTSNVFYPQHIYTPPRPSPLSERSANARPFTFTMASPFSNEKTKPIPQRAHKPNPVVQTRDAATQRRREMFFRRVQKGRDEKKWDARGEQIQHLDFLSEHKRWEDAKAREAAQLQDDIIDDDFEDEVTFLSSYSQKQQQPEQEMEEADYILAQEENELQELIASMEEHEQDVGSQHYGSDDEDYDQLFMECASSAQSQQLQNSQQQFSGLDARYDDVDVMDMS